MAKVLYDGFTKKRYGDGTQVYHDNVVIGDKKRYISLHKIILVATCLDPRMKELSPFLNEDDRESTFEYVLELMDDDLVRVSGDDSDEDEVENDKENMDDSSENDGFLMNYLWIMITKEKFLVIIMRYVMQNSTATGIYQNSQ